MDRDAHSIVYFGRAWTVPTAPLRRRFEESVEAHELKAAGEKNSVRSLLPIVSGSLEDLAATLRMRHTQAQAEKSEVSIYHTNAFLVTPIISSIDLTRVFEQLGSARNFESVITVLMNELENKEGAELRTALTYVSQIDRILTRLLRNFITLSLNKPSVEIDSFLEDGKDFPIWLNKEFKSVYNKAYQTFQDRVIGSVFSHHSSASDSDAIDDFMSEYRSENVFAEPMVEKLSLVYISATSNELGYRIDPVHQVLTKESAPFLHRLMLATETEDARSTRSIGHVLVTADDVRYRAARVVDGLEPAFILKEMV